MAGELVCYVRLEDVFRRDHPLRAIREIVHTSLAQFSRAFGKLYAREGRPSMPPARLLLAFYARQLVRTTIYYVNRPLSATAAAKLFRLMHNPG
jgi:hypothetical protein